MNKQDVSPPAFPHEDSGSCATRSGLTMRQWYAGLALQGVLSTMAAPVGGHDPSLAMHIVDAVECIADEMVARFT